MKKLAVLVFIASLLQACIPAAIIAGATAGGVIIFDHRGISTAMADHSITYAARQKLDSHPALKKRAHIVVATFNKIVLVVGQAPTPRMRAQAFKLVSDVPNIKRIFNEIKLSHPTELHQRTKDTWITTKVKAALLTHKGLHSTQMKVVTENNVVYLMGVTSRSQGTMAANSTRKVRGVRKVVKLFEYIK